MHSLSHDGSWTKADEGIRVMFYDVAVGQMITWTIENDAMEAAKRADTLRDNGYSASLYHRDYTPLSEAEIPAAIAAVTKEP